MSIVCPYMSAVRRRANFRDGEVITNTIHPQETESASNSLPLDFAIGKSEENRALSKNESCATDSRNKPDLISARCIVGDSHRVAIVLSACPTATGTHLERSIPIRPHNSHVLPRHPPPPSAPLRNLPPPQRHRPHNPPNLLSSQTLRRRHRRRCKKQIHAPLVRRPQHRPTLLQRPISLSNSNLHANRLGRRQRPRRQSRACPATHPLDRKLDHPAT